MTREEARQYALEQVNKEIEQHGEDGIAMKSPCVGKCVWTWGEFKAAILNDECLENTNDNPIDMILDLDKYLIVHKQKGLI
jgi:hypothetical protein